MTPIRFHPEAESEMISAALYYESQQKDLGKRFLSTVQDSISHIQINPMIYPIVHLEARRCITRTFPFGVIFRINQGSIVIMAVTHLHRHPDYWKSRDSNKI